MKIDEENLIIQLRKKNEKALDYVIDNYGWVIKSIVFKHLYNLKSVQDECINDVLLGIWNNIGSFDENPKVIVPYIVIDNQKISGSLDSANEIIVSNLVRFTNATKNIPAASAFDDTDYSRILNYRGVVSLARTTVPLSNLKGSDTLAKALQDAWEKSLLANFDSQEATGAATLVIAPEKFLNQKGNKEVLTENIDTIESLYPRANPYSCVYAAKNDHIDSIIVYTLLTGLAAPDDSLDEMYDDVSEQVEMDKARRRSRLQQERKSRAKRRILDYDPNNVDDDEDVPPEEDGPKFSL